MNAVPSPACLLLDLDGTLVDSARDIARSANHVRTLYGLPELDEELVTTFVGDGAAKLMVRTMAGRRDAVAPVEGIDPEAALAAFREHYFEHCLERTQTYPGVVETLRRLHPLPMAIVSNKPEAMCRKIAEGLGLSPWLVAVTGAREGVPVKPDPSLLRLTLAEARIAVDDPGALWMVGDSPNDVLAGRALGATTVGVGFGLADVEALRASGPDLWIDRFAELADRIDAAA